LAKKLFITLLLFKKYYIFLNTERYRQAAELATTSVLLLLDLITRVEEIIDTEK